MYASLTADLEYFKQRPVFQTHTFNVNLKHFFESKKRFLSAYSSVSPDVHAALYYLSDQAFHALENQTESKPLTESQVKWCEQHVQLMNTISLRVLYHLFEACSSISMGWANSKKEKMLDYNTNTYNADCAQWIHSLGYNNNGSQNKNINLNNISLIQALSACSSVFRFGGSGGIGLPWVQVAQCGIKMLKGHQSIHLMVDEAFSICHNGGTIFNKGGSVYPVCSNDFYNILDIQAAGGIASAIDQKKIKIAAFSHPLVLSHFQSCCTILDKSWIGTYDQETINKNKMIREQKFNLQSKRVAAAGGAFGAVAQGAANPANLPPKRACDNLITEESYQELRGAPLYKSKIR